VADATFAGYVTVFRLNTITLDGTVQSKFASGLLVNNSSESQNNIISIGEILFGGDVTYLGGSGNDTFQTDGDSNDGNIFNGRLTVLAGEGDNIFNTDDVNVYNGDVLFQAGGGIDDANMDNGSFYAGSVTLLMGDGDNIYDLNNLPFDVAGNFTLVAGNGDDNVGAFMASVGGAVSIQLGHGANTLTWAATSVVGGTFSYAGGAGVDSLTVAGPHTNPLVVNLGAGADVFTYLAGASVGAATIDFGVDFATDAYVDNGVVVNWNQVLRNLP
jgi:hypothetical protein